MVEDLSYMKPGLSKADWLLECKDADSTVKQLPCHSVILCNASPILCGLDEVTKAGDHTRTVIPFPGDEESARALLKWLYDQQRPLARDDVTGLVKISDEWNIAGVSHKH